MGATIKQLYGPLILAVCAVTVAVAQYDDDFGAPSPPRLVIPGAVPLGPAPQGPRRVARPQGRRQQFVQAPLEEIPQRPRGRPPAGRAGRLPLAPSPAPNPPPQFLAPSIPAAPQRPFTPLEDPIPPRPVIEDAEDIEDDDAPTPGSYSPSPAPTTPPPPPPPQQRPIPNFRPERPVPVFRPERPALLPTPAPELNFVSPTRQQSRHSSQAEDDELPRKSQYSRTEQGYTSRNKVRPTPPAEQQYTRQSPTRAQSTVRAPQKPIYSKDQDYEKPIRQHQRPKKPVAQVLNRYREDNADGSITWGFENDDGSYKEETIGTDCVTRGKYGYIDPDGTRREYSYSTGIPCDKDNEKQPSEGYIDYAENKYVLPNGDSIDLGNMGKNKSRKPAYKPQPQQQYRQ